MHRIRHLDIRMDALEVGGCDFTIGLDAASWSVRASYIGDNPICGLVCAVVDVYMQLLNDYCHHPDATRVGHAPVEVLACGEPGGIIMNLAPQRRLSVWLSVYHITENCLFPSLDKFPGRKPDGEGLVSIWQLVDAVYAPAAAAIRKHGISGFHQAWEAHNWAYDRRLLIFPFEYFVFLTKLHETHRPTDDRGWSLAEECSLLQTILQPAPEEGPRKSQAT